MRTGLVLWAVIVIASSVAAAWWAADQSTNASENAQRAQRVSLQNIQIQMRDASVAGCNRSRADREDAIQGWSAAREARLATAQNPEVADGERLRAAGAAATYKDVIEGYRSRIVECDKAFPPVRIP
jgi:hypothetical protein